MRKRHKLIGMGGTFDHFHAGHEKLILFAAELAEQVLIGVSTEKLTQHKSFAGQIQSYTERVRAVSQFCKRNHIVAIITPLNDPFGPTLEDSQVQALAVTPETLPGGNKINELRENLGLRELPIYICDFFIAENGQALHADQIRAGQMSRAGKDYHQVLDQDLVLNNEQRQAFKVPQGELVAAPEIDARSPLVAVVGDYCLENFIQHHWPYNLGVFDLLQQRQTFDSKLLHNLSHTTNLHNPAGVITRDLTEKLLANLATKKAHLQIEGEEDLAAVALVILAPLGTEIYYGQPQQGMVQMVVTEELKQHFYDVLSSI